MLCINASVVRPLQDGGGLFKFVHVLGVLGFLGFSTFFSTTVVTVLKLLGK